MYYISGLSELEVILLYVIKSRCPISIDKGDQSKLSERATYEPGLEENKIKRYCTGRENHSQQACGAKKSTVFWKNMEAYFGAEPGGDGRPAGEEDKDLLMKDPCSLV